MIIAVLLAWVLNLLSGRSPQLRYLVALYDLMLMTILPLITFGYIAIRSHSMDYAITYPLAERDQIINL